MPHLITGAEGNYAPVAVPRGAAGQVHSCQTTAPRRRRAREVAFSAKVTTRSLPATTPDPRPPCSRDGLSGFHDQRHGGERVRLPAPRRTGRTHDHTSVCCVPQKQRCSSPRTAYAWLPRSGGPPGRDRCRLPPLPTPSGYSQLMGAVMPVRGAWRCRRWGGWAPRRQRGFAR